MSNEYRQPDTCGENDAVTTRAESSETPPAPNVIGNEIRWTPGLPIPTASETNYLSWSFVASRLTPGPDLAYALTQRPPTPDPTTPGCDPKARAKTMVVSVAARQRLINHLESMQAADLRELADSYPGYHEFLSTELAGAVGISEVTAQHWFDRAEGTKKLHQTRAAWEDGLLSSVKVAILRENLAGHTQATITAVESEVLPSAPFGTVPQLREAIQEELIRLDPDAVEKRHEAAADDRRVSTYVLPDGMAGLNYTAPVQDVATVWEALTTIAAIHNSEDDERSIDARRADTLRDLCTDPVLRGQWNGTPLPRSRARRALVNVAMPAGILLGSDEPATLAGYGPITANQARQIAADAELRRLLCDPVDGQLIGLDRTKYRPPTSLADFVQTRDQTCVAPGCRQPAWRCEIDHRERFRTGGATDPDNLACLCKHHHRAKDEGGFTLTRDTNGDHHWHTPLGTSSVRKAKRHWVKPDPHAPGDPGAPDLTRKTPTFPANADPPF